MMMVPLDQKSPFLIVNPFTTKNILNYTTCVFINHINGTLYLN